MLGAIALSKLSGLAVAEAEADSAGRLVTGICMRFSGTYPVADWICSGLIKAPSSTAPSSLAPLKSALAKSAPPRFAPLRFALRRLAPAKSVKSRRAPVRLAPSRLTPASFMRMSSAPAKLQEGQALVTSRVSRFFWISSADTLGAVAAPRAMPLVASKTRQQLAAS